MVIIGERQSNGYIEAHLQNYGRHYEAINKRLQALGLRTFTPEEIRHQIAQAEIDAYFRNDPDAALSASRRLGASFVLRGLISSQAAPNLVMNVNQVSVNMVAFDARCAEGLARNRLETNPPAGLYGAPPARQKAVIKNPDMLRKLVV